jgi:hypothetical protein
MASFVGTMFVVSLCASGRDASNMAFSLELYLKSLALQHAKKLHGHELARLFKNLPEPAKQEIERQIAALSGTSEWSGDIRTLSDIANGLR